MSNHVEWEQNTVFSYIITRNQLNTSKYHLEKKNLHVMLVFFPRENYNSPVFCGGTLTMVILWGNTWMLARSWRAWSRSLDTSSPMRQKLHKWSKWRNLRQRTSNRRRPRRSLFLSGNNWGDVINLLKGLKIWNLTDVPLNIHFPAYKLCWHASLQHYEGTTNWTLSWTFGHLNRPSHKPPCFPVPPPVVVLQK